MSTNVQNHETHDAVTCKSDWEHQRSSNDERWESKVGWSRSEEYLRLSSKYGIEDPPADDEVTNKLGKKAQIQKRLTTARGAAPKDDE